MSILKIKILSKHGKVPTKATKNSAGFDLYSAQEMNIKPGTHEIINTDIAIEIPPACYARVAPRSSLAINFGIDIGGGVIDADYRGNLRIIIINHGKKDFNVKLGTKIAQLILEAICEAQVQVVEALSNTERGESGFGSSDVK